MRNLWGVSSPRGPSATHSRWTRSQATHWRAPPVGLPYPTAPHNIVSTPLAAGRSSPIPSRNWPGSTTAPAPHFKSRQRPPVQVLPLHVKLTPRSLSQSLGPLLDLLLFLLSTLALELAGIQPNETGFTAAAAIAAPFRWEQSFGEFLIKLILLSHPPWSTLLLEQARVAAVHRRLIVTMKNRRATVEVVLRHFHRCRYRSSTAVVLLLEGHRSLGEFAIREYGGHKDLRGSGHRSVIPYVHGWKELYCCVLVLDWGVRCSLRECVRVYSSSPMTVVCPDLL
jgi:hypothetical protein